MTWTSGFLMLGLTLVIVGCGPSPSAPPMSRSATTQPYDAKSAFDSYLAANAGMFPRPGMKIRLAEVTEGGSIIGPEADDEIVQVAGRGVGHGINTVALAKLRVPAVDIFLNIGNATDFFYGNGEGAGVSVRWYWVSPQARTPWPFSGATITSLDRQGQVKRWRIRAFEPAPTTQGR